MSDGDEALRESAANRGLKLVRSRIRTPGRGDYGRYGLKDAKTGKEMLGFGARGLTASAEEVEAFLRGDAATGWKRSLGASARPRKTARTQPPPPPPPPPPAQPKIRQAKTHDADALAALITALGYEVSPSEIRKRLAAVRKEGGEALVVEQHELLGLLTTGRLTVLHRPLPVGRISLLVVAETARGQGLGKLLVAEAENRLRKLGCGLVEVTSNRKRSRAHKFYEGLGYERTSYRFAKDLSGD